MEAKGEIDRLRNHMRAQNESSKLVFDPNEVNNKMIGGYGVIG
jgi:hypothetical protein